MEKVVERIENFWDYCNNTNCDNCKYRKDGCKQGMIKQFIRKGGVNEND